MGFCMDNVVFNVNGSGEKFLAKVLALAFEQNFTPEGWKKDKNKGIVLFWSLHEEGGKEVLPFRLSPTPEKLAKDIIQIFRTEDWVKEIPLKDWDADIDQDGHNSKGWRVFTERWGHIEGNGWASFLCITPAYLWHGK